ncbi:MAG: hypothetical protein ABR953_02410 [Candidatus Acidiferrales bacterium]|jgi:hypothetical protein
MSSIEQAIFPAEDSLAALEGINATKILLIAASPMGVSFLATRLKKWACEIYFASYCQEANAFVNHQ